ncbi:MAG: glycoside hydrolase family 9 protein [Roseburia sp.]|nr:glycoside hydrolase family 9 protein [Roseburia sp.]MCM1097095.1 glycoside hydrolase family 9 protein [Ruminococcus flavefaciens]
MYKSIFVNQCGYLPGIQKRVTIRSDRPVSFSVFQTDGACVFRGMADKRLENASAGETDYVGDFSAVTAPGRYYITAEGHGESDAFPIGADAYDDVFQKSAAFFYLQRCGMKLPERAAGIYAHGACHTSPALVYGTEEKREVSGGWHDAGDYGRYVGPGAMACAQLLYALERNPGLCGNYVSPERFRSEPDVPQGKKDFSEEEGAACLKESRVNSGSDACGNKESFSGPEAGKAAFLDEIRYELDWMLKMQREDGAPYHKASCRRFCGFIMPDEERDELVLSPVSATATGDFAAVCAMAVRFYEESDPAYAGRLAEAARRAYAALKNMELPGGFKNPPEIKTGEYGDSCDEDERYWAAAELYRAFGDDEYREDFERLAAKKIYQGYGWSDMGSYGNLAYLSCGREIDEALKTAIEKAMTASADNLLDISARDGYGASLTKNQYSWGSNLSIANNGLTLYDAWKLTGEEKYFNAAAEQLHYLLGRNPMGLCYVTGCGTDAIRRPHHRPSGFLGKAMPGMLSGGPCSWLADETAKSIFTIDTPPAKCLADMTGSYSTNEVTIYWNSAMLMLLGSVAAQFAEGERPV